ADAAVRVCRRADQGGAGRRGQQRSDDPRPPAAARHAGRRTSRMSNVLDELVTLLALEQIELNLFRGQSQNLGWGTVYGGQVLGQALSAAVQTVPAERHVHSLHGYFLRPGAVDRPIIYEVDRIRDGGTFTTRRVVAIQNGEAIFSLAASFQITEPGFEHQDPMPDAPPPLQVPPQQEPAATYADQLPTFRRSQALAERPFELRPIEAASNPLDPEPRPPARMFWLKATGTLPADPALHRYLLAYASDF